MASTLEKLRAATSAAGVIEALVSGSSEPIRRLREAALDLSTDPLARGAIILGPAGSGKSTLARVIALARYVDRLKPARLPVFLKSMQLDGPARLATSNMDWYRE